MERLGNLLEKNTSLENIQIRLAGFLSKLSLHSYLDRCSKITNNGIQKLAEGLKSSVSLQKISLNFNEYSFKKN